MASTDVARSGAEPPSPRGLPLLGSVVDISRHGMIGFLEQQWHRLGDTFLVRIAGRRMFVVVHPDQVERVLITERDNYVKGRTYDGMRALTGDGLLTLEGEAWRTRRRLEQPSFHRAGVEQLVGAMASCVDSALDRLAQRLPPDGVIEAHQEMMRITLEIVGATLFGQKLDGASTDSSGAAFRDALEVLSSRANAVVQLPLGLPTPSNLAFQRARKLLHEQTQRIIETARKAGEQPTLLSMLLRARDADTGQPLSDVDLRDEVITLFLAGHETTALLLTWAFTLLGKNPDVVAKLRAELARELQGRTPGYDDYQRLTYMRQTIDEILRLRSPTWTVGRDTKDDAELGGFRIRRGDMVLPVNYLTHRHPQFWPDPERFDPGRFAPDVAATRPRSAYFPFSAGPRICIGNTFALLEAQVVLTRLLQRSEFELASDAPVPPIAGITLRPGAPVPVRFSFG